MSRRTIAPCLVLFLALVISTGCIGPFTEMFEKRYENKKEADAVGAIGWGHWIPAVIPGDASDIREVHDIDTNDTWGCFKTQDFKGLRVMLQKVDAQVVQGPIDPGPNEIFRNFSWWPSIMRSSSVEAWEFTEAPLAPALSKFTVRAGIDEKPGTACFYRTQ
mgnify:CR=1 FL=1